MRSYLLASDFGNGSNGDARRILSIAALSNTVDPDEDMMMISSTIPDACNLTNSRTYRKADLRELLADSVCCRPFQRDYAIGGHTQRCRPLESMLM